MTDQRVAYICDRQKCPRCLPECKHTTDIRHAYLFKLQDGTDDTWFEEPTIDVMPVRHAKWIPCAKSGLILTEQMRKEGIRWYGFKCSACNFVRKGNAPRDANYCECCGARMDEDNVE